MGFKPEKLDDEDDVKECIKGMISQNADETEIRYWLSIIPEAKRYIAKKQKKIQRRIEEINNQFELLDAEYKKRYIHDNNDKTSITEKKDKAECMKIRSEEYKALLESLAAYNELIFGYNLELINLEDKFFSIRKMTLMEVEGYKYEV